MDTTQDKQIPKNGQSHLYMYAKSSWIQCVYSIVL